MEIDYKALTPQIPAEGITGTGDYGDSKFYRIACTCGSDDDSINICIEADEHSVVVRHWATVKTDWWRQPFNITYNENFIVLEAKQFANAVINRTRLAFQALFVGYIKFDGETSLTAQQAINYANALTSAVNDIGFLRKENSKKRNIKKDQ